MNTRVAINGFGRIGRFITRLMADRDNGIELVGINSRADSPTLAHLLKYDSVHGTADLTVEYDDDSLTINGNKVSIFRSSEWDDLPWAELGIDVLLETSGKFPDKESDSKHLQAGAKKVIFGAPGKGADTTLVYGVNHETYDPDNHHIISNASCTTNCLAPVAKIVNDEFGLVRGLMTTIHSYTMDQRVLDGSHTDLRRARAAALSLIPTTTGAAVAVSKVIPELEGRLNGLSIRVPTPNVSMVDLTAELGRDTDAQEVNAVFKAASEGSFKGILKYTEEPLVSIDYTSSPYSAILDAPLTFVIDKRMVKLMAWYDNESGFAYRMVDLAAYIGSKL